MKTRALICLLLTLLLACSLMPIYGSAYAVSDGAQKSYEAAAEAMVLLKNENKALPLTPTDKIAIFGEGQVYTDGKTGGFFLMGRGSGYFVPSETPKNPCDELASYVDAGKLGGVYSALSDSYKAAAVTVCSELMPREEREEAQKIAQDLGVKHYLLELEVLNQACFKENMPDRCYHCKKIIFAAIKKLAREHSLKWVLDGTNAEDLKDYRPGFKALKELDIRSPLLEAGFNKREIRLFSEVKGLPTWSKPSMACLASRIPYGQPVSREKLRQIEQGEKFLRESGFTQCRLRHHDTLARLEFLPEEMELFWLKQREIAEKVRGLGFSYVTLDLEGYQSGKMNRELVQNEK